VPRGSTFRYRNWGKVCCELVTEALAYWPAVRASNFNATRGPLSAKCGPCCRHEVWGGRTQLGGVHSLPVLKGIWSVHQAILEEIHAFWFGNIPEFDSFNVDRFPLWFGGARDSEIKEKYATTLTEVAGASQEASKLAPKQQVALVVLLDQFPRSIFRGLPMSYQFDEPARAAVNAATVNGMLPFKLVERAFLTICLGHSEDLQDQKRALKYYLDDVAPFAPPNNRFYEAGRIQTAKYLGIIERFGRFPHRNAILGRTTTAEEARYLEQNDVAPF
jgi:uncharacterized protein (DUF924 family)